VTIVLHPSLGPVPGQIAHSLAALGIDAKLIVPGSLYDICLNPKKHPGMCVGDGWFPDVPSPGNGLIALFGGPSFNSTDISHLGLTASELAKQHDPARSVPSVDPQIEACNEQVDPAAVACWTRLDEYVVH